VVRKFPRQHKLAKLLWPMARPRSRWQLPCESSGRMLFAGAYAGRGMSSLSTQKGIPLVALSKLDLLGIARRLTILAPVSLIISAQEFVMMTVALLFLAQCFREHRFSWMRQDWFAAFVALWIWAFARTLFGHPTATGLLMALSWIHLPIFAAALANWVLPDEATRRRLLFATAGATTFYSADILLQALSGRDMIGRPYFQGSNSFRMTSVFGKPGVGAEISWLFLPALLGLFDQGSRWRAAAFGALCVAGIVLSGDRMALIVLLGYGVLTALFGGATRRPLFLAAAASALPVAIVFFFLPALYEREIESTLDGIRNVGASDYGAIWVSALQLMRDHPFFGVGFHNFAVACSDLLYGPLTVGPHNYPRCSGHPHNIWLQWLVETGAIGGALFATAAAFVFIRLTGALLAHRSTLLFTGLFMTLVMRFEPLSTSTSFLSSWASAPFFLVLGWGLSFAPRVVQPPKENGSAALAKSPDEEPCALG